MDKKERFLRIYADLPVAMRHRVIYVTRDKEPLTWSAIFIEVVNDTKLGKQLLDNLDSLGFI